MGKSAVTKKDELATKVIQHFDIRYGVDETKLEGWQRLCEDVGIPVGPSITKCKKALKGVSVNIVDLMHAEKNGHKPRHFGSKAQLREYIQNTPGKVFPLKRAKENGYLTALLIHVWGKP